MKPANLSPMAVPYASFQPGSVFSFDFTDIAQQPQVSTVYGDQRGYSGSYLVLWNDTDFTLYGTFNGTQERFPLGPGEKYYSPLNIHDSSVQFLVVGQNAQQVHTQSLLHVFVVTKGEIDSGNLTTASSGLNPSAPAEGIGSGTLPAGVSINASQVTAGTFPTGQWGLGVGAGQAMLISLSG